jgi:NADPH-dependent ferric siderophore reductase
MSDAEKIPSPELQLLVSHTGPGLGSGWAKRLEGGQKILWKGSRGLLTEPGKSQVF